MKNLGKAICFYSLLMCTAIIIQSCCSDTYRIIGNGEMKVYEIGTIAALDTVRTPFSLSAEFDVELISAIVPNGFINSAYATSCEQNFVNKLDRSTIEITCDKSFEYDGETYPANENFKDIGALQIETFEFYGASLSITFNQAFINDAIFATGDHTFTVQISTDNDLTLINEVTTYIDL